MKLLMGAAAAVAAVAIAAVPASFTLTSGHSKHTAEDPVVTSTTETPTDTATETPTETESTDPTSDPTVDPTRGWEVEHPNNGKHNGWYKNNGHAYGNAARTWAKCVSTQGKANCDPKPSKDQVSPDVSPTDTPTATDTPTSGN